MCQHEDKSKAPKNYAIPENARTKAMEEKHHIGITVFQIDKQ